MQKWPEVLVLVRHGQSLFNQEKELINRGILQTHTQRLRHTRNADLPLSTLGKKQAEATAKWLKREYKEFDVIFASPFERAEQTARIIARKFPSARFIVEERLREKEVGVIDGLTTEEVGRLFPHEYERKKKEGKYYYRPSGGESYPDVNLRVWSFLTTLVREHATERILIVSHSVVMLAFRKLLEKLSEAALLKIDQESEIKNCGMIAYRFDPSRKPKPKLGLEFYNKIAH